MKVYDKVVQILTDHPVTRNSDKALMWRYWLIEGFITYKGKDMRDSSIDWWEFAQVTSPESIRRSRQKAQQLHPELRATNPIQQKRRKRAAEKGTFIFREQA